VDEGNNWINVSWGPLGLTNPATQPTGGNFGGGAFLANYNLTAAIDSIPAAVAHPVTDFYGNLRPEPGETGARAVFDPGAIEFGSAPGVASFSVSPSTLAFGNEAIGTASGSRTITVTNTGNEPLTGGTFTFGTPTPFTRSAFSGGSCGATLAVGAACTYNVVFTPPTGTANGTAFNGSLAIAFNGATGPASSTGTPVTLTGTGVTPGTLSFTSATNGTLTNTVLGRVLTLTIPTPRAPVTSVVTITNTGAGSLQITAETVTGLLNMLFSSTGTTCSFTTPLAPGGSCTISIRYATPAVPTFAIGFGIVANDGSGTTGGNSVLALIGQ